MENFPLHDWVWKISEENLSNYIKGINEGLYTPNFLELSGWIEKLAQRSKSGKSIVRTSR